MQLLIGRNLLGCWIARVSSLISQHVLVNVEHHGSKLGREAQEVYDQIELLVQMSLLHVIKLLLSRYYLSKPEAHIVDEEVLHYDLVNVRGK